MLSVDVKTFCISTLLYKLSAPCEWITMASYCDENIILFSTWIFPLVNKRSVHDQFSNFPPSVNNKNLWMNVSVQPSFVLLFVLVQTSEIPTIVSRQQRYSILFCALYYPTVCPTKLLNALNLVK